MEAIKNFVNDTDVSVFIIVGLFIGAVIAHLDFKYNIMPYVEGRKKR